MSTTQPYKPGHTLVHWQILEYATSILLKQQSLSYIKQYWSALAQMVEMIVLHELLVLPVPVYSSSESMSSSDVSAVGFSGGMFQTVKFEMYRATILNNYDFWHRHYFGEDGDKLDNEALIGVIRDALHIDYALIYGLSFAVYRNNRTSKMVHNLLRHKISVREMPIQSNYKSILDRVLQETEISVRDRTEALNSLLPQKSLVLDVPLVFNYILEKSHKREDIIPIALDVRDSREARAFRKQLALLDEAMAVGDYKLLVDLTGELRDKLNILGRKLDQPSVGLEIGFPPAVALDPLGIFERIKIKRRHHLVFIDQLYNAGLQARPFITRLGKLL